MLSPNPLNKNPQGITILILSFLRSVPKMGDTRTDFDLSGQSSVVKEPFKLPGHHMWPALSVFKKQEIHVGALLVLHKVSSWPVNTCFSCPDNMNWKS